MNLGAGLGVAVREFQTASGPVDYGLFVGRKFCGVIEAKPEGTTLSGYSEQAARYIADVPKHLVREEGQVRFEYVASGTETLFRDHGDPDPASRRVFTFHRPETLERQLKEPLTLRGRVDVKIVFENSRSDSHQDFADCGKAKAIPKSLVTTFDVRDERNRRSRELVSNSDFLSAYVDSTAANVNLSAKSRMIWS